jgi:hypothetical protein
VPQELSSAPFRGTDAVRRGLLTKAMLCGASWRHLFPDVYVHAAAFDPEDHRMWCRAAGCTLPAGGAVDRYSAAFLHGVDLLEPGVPVSVTVPPGTRLSPHPRRRVSRAALAPGDVALKDGVPTTVPIRTAFDLGRQPGRRDAVVALDAMCHRHLVTVTAVKGYMSRSGRLHGAARLRERLTLVDGRAESPMETHVRLVLHDAGAPPPVAQFVVRDAAGRFLARVDLAYPVWRIAIEYEGDHHRGRATFRRDVARLNALREAGWLVLRFTADDVLRRPGDMLRQTAEAIRERHRADPSPCGDARGE